MKLTGTWKGTTKRGSQIYRVTGNAQDIQDFKDHQGEFLVEEADGTPLFFTSRLTESGNILFNEEKETYYIEMNFKSAVLIDAARQAFIRSSKEDDDNDQEPPTQPEPKTQEPATPTNPRPGGRRKIGGK